MEYERFITYLEDNNLETDYHDLYDFSQLKTSRHELSNLLAKKHFEKKTEAKLKRILNRLNNIHANQTHLEKEIQHIFQDK